MNKFPDTPPRGDMTRKHRMKRLERKLANDGLYIRPVYLDDTYSEYGYFIVSIDDPSYASKYYGQDQG